MTKVILVGGYESVRVINRKCTGISGLAFVGKPCSRMTKHFIRDRRLGIAVTALLLLNCLSVKGGAYLPSVGPAPLRFAAVSMRPKIFSWVPPVAAKLAISAQTNLPPMVSAVSTGTNETVLLADAKIDARVSSNPENLSTNSISEQHSADELLVVTPEMLVDYFKPGSNAKNQTNVRVTTPVGFTPPPSAAEPSSQAIYRSQ